MVTIKMLGGSREKGRSCYLLELDGKKILLDCGVKKTVTKEIVGEAPFLDIISPEEIDMVFLSHAHEDHCVYLPYLYKKGYKGKIYCTKPTKDLVPQYIDTWFKVVEKNGGIYPYEREYIKYMDFKILNYNESISIGNLRATLLPAGHMLGASMVHLEGSKTVLFTGDFSFDNRVLLDPATGLEVDILICDGNHGMKDIDKIQEEKVLMDFLSKKLEKGNVLVPIAPFGRLQEILVMLYKEAFSHPILMDSSLEKAYKKYDEYSSWLSKSWISWEKLCEILDIRKHEDPNEALVKLSKHGEKALILASNAMLNGGLSKEYLNLIGDNPDNGVILNGHQDKTSLGYKLFIREDNLLVERIFLNLKVHPNGRDIDKMLSSLKEDAKIVIVHSTEAKAEEIKNKYPDKNIFIPRISEKIEL